MGMSIIMSTRGVGLLPAYTQNFSPASVTSRPLKGLRQLLICLGYRKGTSLLSWKLLLSRLTSWSLSVSKTPDKTPRETLHK